MTAAELFLKCLETQGVQVIFGLTGEENEDIMMALLNSPIQFVTCRHEQTASFMADMFGRLTGKPGVCLSTLGPGSTNLITGVANANMDNVPLIAIVGQASTNRLHKESHQNIDAVSMYKPITKWATSIREADVIPEVIYKAFSVARQGRPGAILLELPEDIAKVAIDASPLPSAKGRIQWGYSSDLIDRTLKLIAHAKAPLILAGAGCGQISCDKELAIFIEKTHIYGATTFMGKGAISDRSTYSLHTVGLGMKDFALEAFEHADLVICLGYRMVEWLPEYWNYGIAKKIVHIDVAPAEVDHCYLPNIELIGDIPAILQEINKKLTIDHQKEEGLFAKVKEKIMQDLSLEINSDGFPVKPQRNLHDLRTLLHDNDILISDVGAHKMWVGRQYPAYQSKSCFIYNGFCSMGGAIPGAIVAKWLYPEKTVVALCGDGGFMMSLAAIATAAQFHTPIIIIVWEDNSFGLIEWKQEMHYHQHSHVKLWNPDLVAVAKSFGCHSKRIENPNDFVPTFKQAQQDKEAPTIIVVPIDYSENMKLTKRLGELIPH